MNLRTSEKYPGDDVLDIMTQFSINRNNEVERLIRKYSPLKDLVKIELLDFGAGKGEFINRFISDQNTKTNAVEIDEDYKMNLSNQHFAKKSILEFDKKFDYIYSIDVLEHIEDDKAVLKLIYDKLNHGGHFFLYVPAMMNLYSEFDKSIGHYRRYSKSEILDKLKFVGFEIKISQYHEILGYFTSLANRLLFPKNKSLNLFFVKNYDRFVVPVSYFLEKFIPVFFGKSIFVFAMKR